MGINISASTIKDFLICPQKVYYRINFPEESIPSEDMVVGTIVHNALEKFSNNKNLADEYLLEQSNQHQLSLARYEKGAQCLEIFFNKFYSLVKEDDLIEYKFKLKLSDDIFLVGKIDRISGGNLFDWKTSNSVPKSIENDVQFIIYQEAYERLFKSKPSGVFLASLLTGKLVKFKENSFLKREVFNEIIPAIVDTIKYKTYYRGGIISGACYTCPFKKICYTDLEK